MSSSSPSRSGLILSALLLAGVLVWQQASIWKLQSELEVLRSPSAPAASARPAAASPDRPTPRAALPDTARVPGGMDGSLGRRVATLEESVAMLTRGSDYLMDRGQIPPSPAKAAELQATFLDANRSSRDRLGALRLLRRNDLFGSELADVAAQWLVASTNAEVTRTLLDSLRGIDNPSLKNAIQNLAASATGDRRVREMAIAGLRDFAKDPQVESLLWQLASADPSSEVRRRAEETLQRVPMSDARATALAARVMNGAAPLDERLLSLRMLQNSRQQLSQVAPALAQASQMAADPEARIRYYQAFDDVNHPDFMLPLVQGLQDANASVRVRAADALIDYRSNPTVMQWLKVLSESDPDPKVRQEAARAFREEPRREGDRREGPPRP